MRGSLIRYSLSDYATVQGKRRDDRWGQTERASGNKLKMYTHTHTQKKRLLSLARTCKILNILTVWILLSQIKHYKKEKAITCLCFISSFFSSRKAEGIPAMFSCALKSRGHSSPINSLAFFPFKNPVRLICIILESGFCKKT